MNRHAIHSLFLLGGLAACAADEPPAAAPEHTGSIASAYISYQGNSYEGIGYQGMSFGAVTLSGATISGSALIVWRQRPDGTWEQRFPDKLCLWNAARTVQTSCTTVSLASSPSPLAGATWPATLTRLDGTTLPVTVQIGASATQVGAVQPDTAPGAAPAGFALNGSTAAAVRIDGTPGAACSLIPQGQRVGSGPVCNAPGGCRANCDVWLYDVRVPDTLDASGQPVRLCPVGELATALAGTWDATGKFTPSSTLFTFACTNGTVAKCTRWGYRPWDTAFMSNGTTSAALAPYHQACVRAAIADYCADGTSWTRSGTLVDLYDFEPDIGLATGFIVRTRGNVVPLNQATAFVFESSFDGSGAAELDHTRYMGITSPNTPSLECAGRFVPELVNAPPGGGDATDRVKRGCNGFPCDTPPIGSPLVYVDSTPVCAHSELTVGTYLHLACSTCTQTVHNNAATAYCTQPGQHWDAACVQAAQSQCTASQRMAPHGECATGAAIGKFASGCVLQAESDGAHDYCSGSTWDSNCVSRANAICTGGQEVFSRTGLRTKGFCGTQLLVNGG